MNDCIFCKIVKGEVPSHKVYEDDKFVAFLDINPLAPGNTLVIPKDHYRWVYDVPEFGHYWEVAKLISLGILKSLNAESISYLTLGYEVPHAHIRIIPRFPDDSHKDGIDLKAIQNIPADKMSLIASQIRNSIHDENHSKN